MSLRLLILIIGVCLIIGIYLWEVISRKRSEKRHSKVVFNHNLKSNTGIPAVTDDGDTEQSRSDEIKLTRSGNLNEGEIDTDDIYDLNISPRPAAVSTTDDEQIPLILHDIIEADDKPVSVMETSDSDSEQASITEDELLMLVITPASKDNFSGLEILSATKAAGMKFGNMNIFHNYGVGDLKLEKPLFSLANLYEPGEFNLQDMEAFSTRGLILYMCLPTPVEPEIALELMLNTAQRIAESLNGMICDRLRRPLTDEELENMRDKLKRFHKE